jgi:transcription elongation factor GreA
MAEDVSLMDAARSFLATLSDDERIASQAEVERFVRWCGADRRCSQLRASEVANYADTLAGGVADPSRRAEAVKRFLAHVKKSGLTSTNLGTHLRLRKGAAAPVASRGPAPKRMELSQEQRAAMETELALLKAQRPRIIQDIARARADKDFRENAPLDAARQEQAYIEGRIRELEATLEHAVAVEERAAPAGDAVEIGSRVVLRNLASGAESIYTLVRPGEVNAAEGRISYESPVGRALLQQRAGEEVEVSVPSGTLRFRIERVEV